MKLLGEAQLALRRKLPERFSFGDDDENTQEYLGYEVQRNNYLHYPRHIQTESSRDTCGGPWTDYFSRSFMVNGLGPKGEKGTELSFPSFPFQAPGWTTTQSGQAFFPTIP